MLSTRKAVWLFLVFERDLDEGPAVNAIGHLVFETVNSLLQLWPRIGHTIVPGIIPVGTLLYHGAAGPHLPTALDWVAVEPDYSILFCQGSIEKGCWHLTLTVTQPMKVLHFDGSSGAKPLEGTMDTQDLVAWSEMKPDEIMICNFTSHMEVASFLNLESTRPGGGANPELPEDTNTSESDLFSDISASRCGSNRWDHRVGISSDDIERVQDRLSQALARPPVATSGIDWKTVLQVVVDRYASRLEFMHHLLNLTLDDGSIFNHAQQIQRQLRTVLLPHTVFAALPPNNSVTVHATNSWAVPVFRECATSHTAFIVCHGTTLMPSERLLLQAVRETTHGICRVATKMWASGMILGVDLLYPPELRPETDNIRTLVGKWKEDVTYVWVKCRPACGFEEMCYLPTWPIGFFLTPGAPPQARWDNASLWPDPNNGEWRRPQPKCIRRLEPYDF
ncbi:hypothetical protein EV424DRAFT_1473255 [Suillus variegatus]|nr:hypothetical protein EV424DRAFT_1473255 [Suillus variegatus]